MQLLDDVDAHALGRRGGQRHDGHVGNCSRSVASCAVFRPEIVAPFADAMRFVDREQRSPSSAQRSRNRANISRSGAT